MDLPKLLFLLVNVISMAITAAAAGGGIQLILVNNCAESVWPGMLGTAGHPTPQSGGFHLGAGEEAAFSVPVGWSGRVWPRRGCSFDERGRGSCATGDCGGVLRCGGSPGATPATVVEMTLGTPRSPLHFYDVSLVDGFNVPMVVKPVNGQGNCSAAGCDGDLRLTCPSELALKVNKRTVACRSACDVFGTDQYCCRGQYGNSMTCQPTPYSKKFKEACPTAYSYAYDDKSSILTCSQADYIVTFCSNRNQSVCSYHKHRLVCSGSSRYWPIMPTLMIVLLFSFVASQFSV